MRAQTSVRSKQMLRHRLQAFEKALPELTLMELEYLLDVLKRKGGPLSRHQVDRVRKEIDGRRIVYPQPSVVMP